MLANLTILLVCQLVGEVIARFAHLPLPGPVVGMALLFIGLLIKGGVPKGLDQAATTLLSHLSVLFIPAGVGIVAYLGLIEREWLPIGASLVLGTLLSIAVTGVVMDRLIRRQTAKVGGGEG